MAGAVMAGAGLDVWRQLTLVFALGAVGSGGWGVYNFLRFRDLEVEVARQEERLFKAQELARGSELLGLLQRVEELKQIERPQNEGLQAYVHKLAVGQGLNANYTSVPPRPKGNLLEETVTVMVGKLTTKALADFLVQVQSGWPDVKIKDLVLARRDETTQQWGEVKIIFALYTPPPQ